ncbi:hypothetical protein GCM10010106_06600 [Thermopolyspora flexuosa]|nr:hypothetical protein GCM10010106_06600 [Thermopolyspora flexuosa]
MQLTVEPVVQEFVSGEDGAPRPLLGPGEPARFDVVGHEVNLSPAGAGGVAEVTSPGDLLPRFLYRYLRYRP